MKKLLLFVAAMFTAVTMSAQTASFYATGSTAPGTDNDVVMAEGVVIGQTFTNAAASITFTKKNNSESQVTQNAVRWYQNDIMTVTPAAGVTITEIVWTIATGSKGAPTCESGTIEGEGTTNGSTVTWTGSENGQFEFVAAKQVRFSSMVITYSTGSPTGIEDAQVRVLDINAPMYNVMGQQVNAEYKGIVIQNGHKYILR